MIIRKPYAFLIKNFKKIHILLFAISVYVYYYNTQLNSFVKEFMRLETYDYYNEPITKYVTFTTIAAMLLLSIGSIVLIWLLRHKKKPWKLYIIPAFEYLFMIGVFLASKSFFDKYNGIIDSAAIRAIRDLLNITSVLQYPSMFIFLIRAFGVDLNKFNFKSDEEFLELNNEDREELEINIEIDKDSLKRFFKKTKRNISYVYTEHKFVINIIVTVVLVVSLFTTYRRVFVTNKSYSEGEGLGANGYTITINESYYTDKDYRGKDVSSKSAFVIVNMTIKNNLQTRVVDLQKFHVMNGISNYITTAKMYETEFHDFGKTYQKLELKRDASETFVMIFRVDKKLPKNKYVLYYQEFNGDTPYLRKIKLKLNDVSKIEKHKTLNLGDEMNFTIKGKKEMIIFDDYEILDKAEYSYRVCTSASCTTKPGTFTAPNGYKILKISFASNNFEGKDMIDFSTKYGTINYIDSKNKKSVVSIKNPFNKTYYGKYLFIRIPIEVANSSAIELEYTIRNNNYIYKLR